MLLLLLVLMSVLHLLSLYLTALGAHIVEGRVPPLLTLVLLRSGCDFAHVPELMHKPVHISDHTGLDIRFYKCVCL